MNNQAYLLFASLDTTTLENSLLVCAYPGRESSVLLCSDYHVNIEHLRHSLKVKWLLYYRQNRPWLVKLQIWGTYEGQRRPSSGFILATLSNLEPQLTQVFPFIVALSNNPDQIVAALGLNFNPDQELKSMTEASPMAKTNGNGNGLTQTSPVAETNGNGNGLTEASPVAETNGNGNGLSMQMPPNVAGEVSVSRSTQASNITSWVDESCSGKGSSTAGLVFSILVVLGSLAVVFVGFTG